MLLQWMYKLAVRDSGHPLRVDAAAAVNVREMGIPSSLMYSRSQCVMKFDNRMQILLQWDGSAYRHTPPFQPILSLDSLKLMP